MRSESSKHHMLWRRADYQTPLEKRVRGLFIIQGPEVNHRLLHLMMLPPPKPHHDTLMMMKILGTPQEVIEYLDDPIADHFEEQLNYLALPREEAYQMLRNRTPEFDGNHRRAAAASTIVAMLAENNPGGRWTEMGTY